MTAGNQPSVKPIGPLDEVCSLCLVRKSTGPCRHLIDLGDDRVGMPRAVWEGLIEDRLRLRKLEAEPEP